VLGEDERIDADVERYRYVAEHIEGGGAGPGFVAADLGDVDADVLGECLLGEASLFTVAASRVAKSMVITWMSAVTIRTGLLRASLDTENSLAIARPNFSLTGSSVEGSWRASPRRRSSG
jgi:hypothetical protein